MCVRGCEGVCVCVCRSLAIACVNQFIITMPTALVANIVPFIKVRYIIQYSLSLPHTHTHTHTLSLSLSLSLMYTHFLFHSLCCLFLIHTHTHTLSLTLSLSFSLSLSLFLSRGYLLWQEMKIQMSVRTCAEL